MSAKNQKLFVTVCTALWGPTYQSAAVEDLEISRSSLVRYANGTREIPAEVFSRLGVKLDQRKGDLATLATRCASLADAT